MIVCSPCYDGIPIASAGITVKQRITLTTNAFIETKETPVFLQCRCKCSSIGFHLFGISSEGEHQVTEYCSTGTGVNTKHEVSL